MNGSWSLPLQTRWWNQSWDSCQNWCKQQSASSKYAWGMSSVTATGQMILMLSNRQVFFLAGPVEKLLLLQLQALIMALAEVPTIVMEIPLMGHQRWRFVELYWWRENLVWDFCKQLWFFLNNSLDIFGLDNKFSLAPNLSGRWMWRRLT